MKDVIVIGAGLAGLTCSTKLAQNSIKVKLFAPAQSERSQSVMAMGGINAALNTKGQDDSVDQHYNDTMKGGQYINNKKAVKRLTSDAPKIIQWLSEIGTSFNRDENGNVDVRYFGGQKKMRTAYAGARTGKQIVTALITQTRKYESSGLIKRYTGYRFLSLILNEDNTKVMGVLLLNEVTDEILALQSDNIVIATGGMNKLFGKTSGSILNDGCTTGLLLQQNVELANLEMIQYHPTTVDTPVKRMLITEAARGEGGRLYTLVDNKKWYFMEEWYPELGALMPRDVVSRSIYKVCHDKKLTKDDKDYVYLDLTHLPEKTVKNKLDEVYEVCTKYMDLDPTRQAIPVYPGVHYFMGGIRTDDTHKTNIKGLYAIGECSSQYHGANRLGGNSLLGAIHGGWIVSEQITQKQVDNNENYEEEVKNSLKKEKRAYEEWKKVQEKNSLTSSYEIEKEISAIMNSTMGIYRNEKQLTEALNTLTKIEGKLQDTNSHGSYYEYIRLGAITILAKAMIKSALERKESRGAHQRIEYPECNQQYDKTTTISFTDNNLSVQFRDTDEEMGW